MTKERDIIKRLREFAIWNNRHSHYDPVPLCQEAATEIERFRAAATAQESRNAVVEECAKIADGIGNDEFTNVHRVIAARIRALSVTGEKG